MPNLTHLHDLANEINDLHRKGIEAARWSLKYFIECGDRLRIVRDELSYGDFGPWLEGNFKGGRTTAYKYIKLSERKEELVHRGEQVGSMREAFRLLGEYDASNEDEVVHRGEQPPDESPQTLQNRTSEKVITDIPGETSPVETAAPAMNGPDDRHPVGYRGEDGRGASFWQDREERLHESPGRTYENPPNAFAPEEPNETPAPPVDAAQSRLRDVGARRIDEGRARTNDTAVGGEPARKPRHEADDAPSPIAGKPRRSPFDYALDVVNSTIVLLNTLCSRDKSLKENKSRLSEAYETLRSYSPTALLVDLPDWIDPGLWDQLIILRGRQDRHLTAHGARLMIKKLARLRTEGHDPNDLIALRIERGWRDFYPEDEKTDGTSQRQGSPPPSIFGPATSDEQRERIWRAAFGEVD